MLTTVFASRSVLDQALEASRAIGAEKWPRQAGEGKGLNADLDGALKGWLREAWASAEHAIKQAFVHGWEKVRGVIEESCKNIEAVLAKAGERAAELHALLLERIREFVSRFLNDAIALLPSKVQIGTQTLGVTGLTCTQKVKIGGKLEVNLLKVCELVSEGEFAVEVAYGPSLPEH